MRRNTTNSKEHCPEVPAEHQLDDFDVLLRYMNHLANHKLGYPVSLLTFAGIVDNKNLGIEPGSLANVLLNNVGDPFKDSETSRMEVKQYERKLIAMLGKYFGKEPEDIRGYVTTGGTEGNFAGLWWSKRYLVNCVLDKIISVDHDYKLKIKEEQELHAKLARIPLNEFEKRNESLQKILDIKKETEKGKQLAQQLLTPTVFFTKEHTHYSIPKIAEILRMNVRPVLSKPDGSVDLNSLHKELLLNLGAHPKSPIVVIANIGTTITGAVDDVNGIKKILDGLPSKPIYTIHLDGALTGFVMPVLKPFGDIPNYFDALGVNTISFSAHKYPGLPQPCGIILARKEFFEKAFEKTERAVEYVGNILDVTVTGSRSGLNVLMFYNALITFGMDKDCKRLHEIVKDNLNMSHYLYQELVKIYGADKVSNLYHFNVSFPRPSIELAKEYQLMLTGEKATICVLPNVTKELIDKFIVELKLEKESVMTKSTTKTDFAILTLQDTHMKETIDLFVRSFCDSEPITKHLNISYADYEPFAREVVQKAIKDGMSVIAIDKNNKVVACAIAEDMTDPFQPTLSKYPKLKPIFGLLDKLSASFLEGKTFAKGKVAHVWIAIVDAANRGEGLSTQIDMACGAACVRKGYDFVYAEFTNDISEKITHHYDVFKLCNTVKYDDFKQDDTIPFKGVKGGAASYIIGIRPGVKLDALKTCYKVEAEQ